MKKIIIPVLCSIFLLVPSLGFNYQDQDHQHSHSGLKQYQERLTKYGDRMYWQMPQRVMDELGIKPGMTIADVGAEIGYFTLRLAKRVGEEGKVYASTLMKMRLPFWMSAGEN